MNKGELQIMLIGKRKYCFKAIFWIILFERKISSNLKNVLHYGQADMRIDISKNKIKLN